MERTMRLMLSGKVASNARDIRRATERARKKGRNNIPIRGCYTPTSREEELVRPEEVNKALASS